MIKATLHKSLMTSALCLTVCMPVFAEEQSSPIQATIHHPDKLYDGYLFWHQADELRTDVDNITLLTDAKGKVVHTWPATLTGGGHTSYLLENGNVLRPGRKDNVYSRKGPVASFDVLQIIDKKGKILWEVSAKDLGNFFFHHDMEPMANGNFLVVTYHPLTKAQARAIGWDAGDAKVVWSDGVMEIKPNLETGKAEIVWAWQVADHIVQDRFKDAPNYGIIADHPGRIDPHYPKSYAPMNIVRQHINSVDYNAEHDQVVLSAFIFNEIWIVDHSTTTEEARTSTGGRTGRGGDLLFRYGNPEAYDMGGPDDREFLRQHDANWIEDNLKGSGNLLIHDNNTNFRPRRPGAPQRQPNSPALTAADVEDLVERKGNTQVYELKLPINADGSYCRKPGKPFTAEVIWKWESPEYFADFQGGARRLPNGSTLLSDTTDYLAIEISAEGEIVAEYKGATPVYKAFKFSPEEVKEILKK